MIDGCIDFFFGRFTKMAYLCTCALIDPPVRKGNKKLPDANTHKEKEKIYNIKRERKKKGKENYLPRQ